MVSNSLHHRGLYPSRLLCSWDFPGKNTGVGGHFLLQGIFLTQGSNPRLLCLLHWQVDSLPLSHVESPKWSCVHSDGKHSSALSPQICFLFLKLRVKWNHTVCGLCVFSTALICIIFLQQQFITFFALWSGERAYTSQFMYLPKESLNSSEIFNHPELNILIQAFQMPCVYKWRK